MGPTDFGDGPRSGVGGDEDAFLARYDRAGHLLTFAQFGDDAAQWATGVATNERGDLSLFATGYGSTDFGNGAATPAGWLVGFSAARASPWVVSSFAGNPAPGALDADGLLTIVGTLQGPVNLGAGTIGVSNSEFVQHKQFYLASYDATGQIRWSKAFLEGTCSSLVPLPEGGIVLAGGVGTPSLDLGCGATPAGATSYVAALASNGSCLWTHWFKATMDATVAADGNGGCVAVGATNGATEDEVGPIAGTGAIYVERFGPDGTPAGAGLVGALQSGTSIGIASVAASPTSVWLAGGISGTLQIAGTTLGVSAGSDVGFIVRLGI